MKIIRIPKKSGGVRIIYAPNKKEKTELRALLKKIPQPKVQLQSAHGFMKERSPVTNAKQHVPNFNPKAIMISCDISNFFPNVQPTKVSKFIPEEVREEIMSKCFPDGAAQQGLPTSPALANLAGISIDEAIRKKIKKKWHGAIYTRYADDLTISFPQPPEDGVTKIIEEVEEIVRRCGYSMNKKKTRIQRASFGRWGCCGVMIDGNGIHAARRQRRMLRLYKYISEKHGNEKAKIKAAGMEQWVRLPNPITEEERMRRTIERHKLTEIDRSKEASIIAKQYKIPLAEKYHETHPDIVLEKKAIITQDPVMIYGMSTITTGWKSCMGVNGGYFKGAEYWRRLTGASIAYIPDKSTKVWCGIARPKMKERTLVFETEDGQKKYMPIYPKKNYSGMELGGILRRAGYVPATHSEYSKVIGEVECDDLKQMPYFDSGYQKKTNTVAEYFV